MQKLLLAVLIVLVLIIMGIYYSNEAAVAASKMDNPALPGVETGSYDFTVPTIPLDTPVSRAVAAAMAAVRTDLAAGDSDNNDDEE